MTLTPGEKGKSYTAFVLRVVDGDTVDLIIDLGFNTKVTAKCRLYAINAPELSTPEGKAARDFLESLVDSEYVEIVSFKRKGVRFAFDVVIMHPEDTGERTVNQAMVNAGHAKPCE